jgi:hypothetical protein
MGVLDLVAIQVPDLRPFPGIFQETSGKSPKRVAFGGMPTAKSPTGTKLATATTKDIIVFRMAALTCGYGARDPYSEKGKVTRPFSCSAINSAHNFFN